MLRRSKRGASEKNKLGRRHKNPSNTTDAAADVHVAGEGSSVSEEKVAIAVLMTTASASSPAHAGSRRNRDAASARTSASERNIIIAAALQVNSCSPSSRILKSNFNAKADATSLSMSSNDSGQQPQIKRKSSKKSRNGNSSNSNSNSNSSRSDSIRLWSPGSSSSEIQPLGLGRQDSEEGSSGSCTASTSSLTLNASSSPTPFDNLSFLGQNNQKMESQNQKNQQKQKQPPSRQIQPPPPSPMLTSSSSIDKATNTNTSINAKTNNNNNNHNNNHNNNLSPRTESEFVDHDDQTITRLDNECIKLSLAMSRLRKYTQEWFFLETKLQNATEELEAAKEDRDLHFYLETSFTAGGDGGAEKVGGKVTMNIEVPSACPSVTGSENLDRSMLEDGEEGVGVPEAVFFDGLVEQQQQAATRDMTDDNINDNENDEHRYFDDDSDAADRIRLEYRRKEIELKKLPKFSEEWFQLKEELVELNIALDEADNYRDAEHDTPIKEIEVVAPIEEIEVVVNNFSDVSTSPVAKSKSIGVKPKLGSVKKEGSERNANSIDSGSMSKKKSKKKKKQQEQTSPPPPTASFGFRPISPSPRSTSPYPMDSNNISSLSPYPTSNGTSNASSSHNGNCLSPYHLSSGNNSQASSRNGSISSAHNYMYSQKLLLHGHDGDSRKDSDDDNNSEDEEDLADTIARLKNQQTTLTEELSRLPQFSKEWFDVKTIIVGLEEQIEEIKINMSGSSFGGDSSNMRNRSYTSGWTSVWSESEEEIMSYADDLECVMVAEALKQNHGGHDRMQMPHQSRRSSSSICSEDEEDPELLLMQPMLQDLSFDDKDAYESQRIANSAIKKQAELHGRVQCESYNQQQESAIVIQSWLRKERAASKFQRIVISTMRIQLAWRYRCEAKLSQLEQQDENDVNAMETSAIDNMLDDFALLLGDVEQDELIKQNYNASVIQEWWCSYAACQTVVSMRRKAMYWRYQVLAHVKQQKQQPMWRRLSNMSIPRSMPQSRRSCSCSIWENYSSASIQALWRGYRARRNYQRYESCVVKIQSVVRGRQQRRKYEDEYEMRCVQLEQQRIISSTTKIEALVRGRQQCQRYAWARKCATRIQSAVRERQQRRHYAQILEMVILIQSFFRKVLVSAKFKNVLYSTLRIQRVWRKALREEPEAVAALPEEQPQKNIEFDSVFDEMAVMLGNEQDDEFERHNYHAIIIQEQWRNYRCCKPLVSMRRRALQYQALAQEKGQQQHEEELCISAFAVVMIQTSWRQHVHRKEFQHVKSKAVKIQAMVRSQRQHQWYHEQHGHIISIQSFLRKYWLATGRVYTDRHQVIFHSKRMGIRLQRGKDGFVRVLTVAEGDYIVREGTIAPGDFVVKACGLDLQSPITKDQWVNAIEMMKNASRPMQFVVASGSRRIEAQLLVECQCVLEQLQCLASIVRIQRVWKKHAQVKHKQEETVQASIVIQSHVRQWLARCLYVREMENATVLAECMAMLAQLKALQSAIMIQACTRRVLAGSSISRKQESSIRAQAFVRMELQRSRYKKSLASVVLIQGVVKKWLVRRSLQDTHDTELPAAVKLEKEVIALSMQLNQLEDFSQEWTETAGRLRAKQKELHKAREKESCHSRISDELKENNMPGQVQNNDEIKSTQESSESFGGLKNFWLLREQSQKIDNNDTPADQAESANRVVAPTRTKPTKSSTPVESPVISHAQEGPDAEIHKKRENLSKMSSVARMKQALEANASAPIFPLKELTPTKDIPAGSSSQVTPSAHQSASQAGEIWSPETELLSINIAKFKENLESNTEKITAESVRSSTPAESIQSIGKDSTRSSTSGNKKRSVRRRKTKKKKLTPEENMKNLSTECLGLSHRMKSLPKFSPEWTLAKIEMNLITDELEYLYAESMNKTKKGAPA